MCGIVGEFNFATGKPVDRSLLCRMTESLAHRGPDDSGLYISGSLGLGFRRLAILDLTQAGHQPMSDESGKIWVVFNGEIFNFLSLRQELEARGHMFRSNTDTEVILRGFVEWGDDILQRLNGMFGLAIWDGRRRRLLVARDAMGIKPLYYHLEHGTLRFGSEIRPLMTGLGRRPSIDVTAISLFLRYRYTPAPLTAFMGIRKLAAGERLIVENGTVSVGRWYQFDAAPFKRQPSDEEATHTLLELYKAAVQRHLISDVPVGLLLSGGIDSGLLLGLMKLHGNNWRTYTVGYGASFDDDELNDAAGTARQFGVSNTPVLLDQRTFEDALPRIVQTVEEPIASSSIVPMYFVCERARQDVKVAIVGQGPDELFGGYTRHLGVAYGCTWRRLPRLIRQPLEALVGALPRGESLKRGVYSLNAPNRIERHQRVFSLIAEGAIASLFRKDVLPKGAGDPVLDFWSRFLPTDERLDELGEFQLIELRSSLPDELLMYGDKLSMAHSLEARVPFLDKEVVEYVQRLGPHFKVRNGRRKWLHKRVCKEFLPRNIIQRKKRGFAVNVVDDWFRQSMEGSLSGHLRDPQASIYDFLDFASVQMMEKEHRSGRRDNHKVLFSLVVLEEWLRMQV